MPKNCCIFIFHQSLSSSCSYEYFSLHCLLRVANIILMRIREEKSIFFQLMCIWMTAYAWEIFDTISKANSLLGKNYEVSEGFAIITLNPYHTCLTGFTNMTEVITFHSKFWAGRFSFLDELKSKIDFCAWTCWFLCLHFVLFIFCFLASISIRRTEETISPGYGPYHLASK